MRRSRITATPPAGLAGLSGLCLLLALAGCTGDGSGSKAEKPTDPTRATAESLVRALGEHTLSGVPLADPAAEQTFARAVAAVDDTAVEVSAGAAKVGEATAQLPLSWSWTIDPEHTWSYRTTVRLTRDEADGADEGAWLVDWTPEALAPELTETEVLDFSRSLPRRADVLGAGGKPLVTERPVVRYGLDKVALGDRPIAPAARRIARAVGIRPGPFVKQARAAGERAFVEAITLRADETWERVDPEFAEIPGARTVDDTLALAPTADFAAPILGRVGPATAEIVERSEGRIRAGDVVGLSGLQARYDEQLAGTATTRVSAVPICDGVPCPDGEPRVLHEWAGADPEPLRLTLDERLQARAESALAELPASAGAGALVAIRPSDGAILAAANGAGTDGANLATYGRYAPGSTFKIVTTLALLRDRTAPGDTLACPPTITVDGKVFKNYDDYPASRLGEVSLRTAFANSCNTAFIGARNRVDTDALATAAHSLGLGLDYDVGFPAYFGQVPASERQTEAAAALIGQGKVLASPMAMAGVAASVAAGHTVVPHLVAGHAADSSAEQPLTGAEARQLRTLMRAVVTEGSGRSLADLGEIGAKTGTAEYGSEPIDGSLPTHAWMVATRGDLAVAVFVETGQSGSATAGPVLRRFLR